MSLIQSFFNLDLDRILNSIESAGFQPTGHCLALNSLENRVYRIGIEEEEEDKKEKENIQTEIPSSLVVKFYRPGRWTREQIQEEHDFLFELEKEEIPVLTPVQSKKDKKTIHEAFIHPEDPTQPIYYTLWPTLRGRIVEELNSDNLESVGRLLARIHNVGSANPSQNRLRLDLDDYAKPALNYLLESNRMNPQACLRYKSIAEKIFTAYTEVSESIPSIRIHGDCHKGNLLQDGNIFTFLDFDDFMTGIPTQDLWMLLPFGDSHAEYERNIFLESYREFRDFPETWLEAIEPLRAIRYIYYSAWIAKRWEDPSFPNAFPHFGTDSYWEKEIRDLEQLYYNWAEDRERN